MVILVSYFQIFQRKFLNLPCNDYYNYEIIDFKRLTLNLLKYKNFQCKKVKFKFKF